MGNGYFIILRGPLGCGKSTIAKKLVDVLDAEYVDMDKVLQEQGLDKIDPEVGCIPASNFIKANRIILSSVKDKLQSGKIVVFDACFYYKATIDDLVQQLPYSQYGFTLRAPLKVCIERDSKRKRSYGEGAATAVHSLVSRFDYGTVIDVTRPLNETMKDILGCLPTKKE
ncbi:MAG: AAA family ATPase [Nanoarchaeota archaeon]